MISLNPRFRRALATAGAAALLGAVPLAAGTAGTAQAAGTGVALPAGCVLAAHSSSVTCTQTDPAKHAWDPTAKKLVAAAPSITVSQTQNLVNQVVHVTWTHFTPSRLIVPGAGFLENSTLYAVGVYECGGPTPSVSPYADGQANFSTDQAAQFVGHCYRYTVDDPKNATSGQANGVRTFTAPDGTGEADVQIETSIENDVLGCSQTVPCSLVVVPQFGGPSAVKAYDPTKCANHAGDATFFGGRSALDNFLGDTCSWADRLSVPLTFAPLPTACPQTGGRFESGGSPMLNRALEQWRPGWCQGADGVAFDYNGGLSEYEAREAFFTPDPVLGKPYDVAFTTQPADAASAAQRHFTYAPVANSSISISFVIDDSVIGKQLTDLRLDARLMAKLLTQSYALRYGGCAAGQKTQTATCDPAVAGNPDNILADPEFQQLNPQWADLVKHADSVGLDLGGFLPTVISGNSDITYELTRWISSDADARAFLAGTPDPWHMHVNTYYAEPSAANPAWPLSQFQNQDPGFTDESPKAVSGNGTMQVAWSPISGLDKVTQYLAQNKATPTNVSSQITDPAPPHYDPLGPEAVGSRFLIAVLDQGDAETFGFPSASLQTSPTTFVAPTTASVEAALSSETTGADGVTQRVDDATLSPAAYPLTMTDYAMVPTCGLAHATAGAVSTVLSLMATSGQTSGEQPGQLANGYVPLSDAQRGQTAAAATDVRAQDGCPPATPRPSTGGAAATAGGGDDGPAAAAGGGPVAVPSTGLAALVAGAHGVPGPLVAAPAAATTSAGRKYGSLGGGPDALVPALVVGMALLVGGPAGWYLRTSGGLLAGLRPKAGA